MIGIKINPTTDSLINDQSNNMIHKLLCKTLIVVIIFILSCNNQETKDIPEDGLDAAREFVRAVLDADYVKAEDYILNDEANLKLFKSYTDYMKKRPSTEITALKQSNMIINSVENQGDSVEIINYANSFSKEPTDIKVVKRNNQWHVDFRYTISGKSTIEKNSK